MNTIRRLFLATALLFAPALAAQETEAPPILQEILERIERMSGQLMALQDARHGEAREEAFLEKSLKLTFEKTGENLSVSISCASSRFAFSRRREEHTAEHGVGESRETHAAVFLRVKGEIRPIDKPNQYLIRVNWEDSHIENTGEGEEREGAETRAEQVSEFSGSAIVKLGERTILLQDGPNVLSLVVTEE